MTSLSALVANRDAAGNTNNGSNDIGKRIAQRLGAAGLELGLRLEEKVKSVHERCWDDVFFWGRGRARKSVEELGKALGGTVAAGQDPRTAQSDTLLVRDVTLGKKCKNANNSDPSFCPQA